MKRDVQTASFAIPCLSCYLPMPGSSAFPPRLSAPPSPSTFGLHVLGLSALSASGAPVPGSSAPPSPSGRLPVSGSSVLSVFGTPMPKSSTPPSLSGYLPMPGLSALPPGLSAPLSPSTSNMSVPRLSAQFVSGPLMPGSSTPLSPCSCLPVPRLSAPFSSSCLPLPGPSPPGLSPSFFNWSSPPGLSPSFLNWLSPQTSMPILGKQRLDQ